MAGLVRPMFTQSGCVSEARARLLVECPQVSHREALRRRKRLQGRDVAAQFGVHGAHGRSRAAGRLALHRQALVLHEQRRRHYGEYHYRRERAGDQEVEVRAELQV